MTQTFTYGTEVRDKQQDYKDACERVEVERRFSLTDQKCGLELIIAKLSETALRCVVMLLCSTSKKCWG